ncbi:RECEPTOR KINASE-LIKE PROTEIN XA21 [Salix viminalis]|nr:RECEPTOR KINASE-LIKE PROTEIN XA21 [Salix viminalis]
MQEGKTIDGALDEEIKEPCYVDEMSNVFHLGVSCTSTVPSDRPQMKEVLQILQGRSRPLVYGVKNTGREYDSTPLLKN